MRRMHRILAVVLCLFLFTTTAYASNTVNSVMTDVTVYSDGSCQVVVAATVFFENPVGTLTIPLASGISGVTLNGSPVNTTHSGGVTSIKLEGLGAHTGSQSFTIRFTVDNALSTNEKDERICTIPLLPNFPYPVEKMEFTVTMPAEVTDTPSFSSGYHGQDIERRMTTRIDGNQITGVLNEVLKDSETLYLRIPASTTQFPQRQIIGGTLDFDGIAMGVCMAVAMLYWLLTMGCTPSISRRRSIVPEGANAGVLGCYLVHRPVDLTMMVINWAQLGYLTIELTQHGRVILYKKMSMGNERSVFEQRAFGNLFGRGNQIDATSSRYTIAYERIAALTSRYIPVYRSGSGNPRLFRLLACTAGIFAGFALGDSIATTTPWRIGLMIAGAIVFPVASWYIQEGMDCLHLRNRAGLKRSLLLSGIVLLIGLGCKCFPYLLVLVLWNLFAGLAAAYGGRRTENSQRMFTQILGLRRYMRRAPKEELQRILQSNYGYYYELAPYALALGVDRQFAARFESAEQPMCTWLITPTTSPRVAREWYPLLRKTAAAMTPSLRKKSKIHR